MKKLLLSLALIATGAGIAAADTTVEFSSTDNTIAYTGNESGTNVNPLESITKDGLIITFTKDNGSAKGSSAPAWYYILSDDRANAAWRMYANNTFTVAAPAGQTVKKIEMYTPSSWDATTKYGNLTADAGTITAPSPLAKGMTVTWTGDAASVKIAVPAKSTTGAAAQLQMNKIVVTLGGEGGTSSVAAPVISGTATFYGATNTVTITGPEGATIYYTMQYNGEPTDPTTSSLTYEDEIVINNTATIKAIAVKDGITSSVASKTFTKGEAVAVANIAELLTKEKGTVCTVTGPVTVMGLYNKRYLFVQDATGALQIFSAANGLDFPYQMGQTISGFTGKTDVYNGTPQLSVADFEDSFPASGAGTAHYINPTYMEPTAEAVQQNLNRYVYTTGNITKTGNNFYIQTVQLYDRFNLQLVSDALVAQTKDAAGFAVMFNTTPEIFVAKVGEPNTLAVDGVQENVAPIYGAEGYVVAPAAAQIYTVGGVRVANSNLSAGIYLVRYNGNTTKVVVR